MATLTQKVYDRCGKPMKYVGWTAKLKNVFRRGKRIRIIKYHNGNPSGYDYVECEYELCGDCTEKLSEFLRG